MGSDYEVTGDDVGTDKLEDELVDYY